MIAILVATRLKDGNGRELCELHDTILQHLRALKGMGYEPSTPFVTSTTEPKLDQKRESVSHCQYMLEFLNLCVQATESAMTCHMKIKPLF